MALPQLLISFLAWATDLWIFPSCLNPRLPPSWQRILPWWKRFTIYMNPTKVIVYLSVFSADTFLLQILTIARGQRQIIHRMENLSNLLQEKFGEKKRHGPTTKRRKSVITHLEPLRHPAALALALGGFGFCLFKRLWTRNWSPGWVWVYQSTFNNMTNLREKQSTVYFWYERMT